MSEDPVAELRRWEAAGGHWRLLDDADGALTVRLLTCDGGEEMGRIVSASEALRAYVAGRSSED